MTRATCDRATVSHAGRGASRRVRRGARGLLVAALLGAALSWSPGARADDPAPVVFVIDLLPWGLEAEPLRAAIARELGIRVTLADKGSGPNTLTLRGDRGGHVALSYRAPDGRLTE